MSKKKIAIIGGGPAAMSLACHLDKVQYKISIYEKNKALGRKFLVAGKGGFNLTHGESIDEIITRYEPVNFLTSALKYFDNVAMRAWLKELGIPTYIGSSKRVFPEKGTKPIAVLNAIKQNMEANEVQINYGYKWVGRNEGKDLLFENGRTITADLVVFALGGGSWKVTGSDGGWLDVFRERGISVSDFSARNCAFEVEWKEAFIESFAGAPLKNISLSCGEKRQMGELVVTEFGLEGNAIYALSSEIQGQLADYKEADIFIDLKPSLTLEQLSKKYKKSSEAKPTQILRKDLKLSKVQLGLIKAILTKEQFLDIEILLSMIKRLPLKVCSAASLDEAISTAGGVDLSAVDSHYKLEGFPDTYCIGEMLDWNVSTGGYLLQGCFSMGAYLARYLNQNA